MFTIATDIIINAPKEKVWQVLTDFANYSAWNKFMSSVTGNLAEGEKLEIVIHPGKKTMKFKPVVIKYDPEHCFVWCGGMISKKLFAGEHSFELQTITPTITKLIHKETFSGILAKAIFSKIKDDTHAGFQAMNVALKQRVEGQ